MTDQHEIELAIARAVAAPAEELAETYSKLCHYIDTGKQLKQAWEKVLTERVKTSGPFEFPSGDSTMRAILKHPKLTKCLDVPKAIETLLVAVDGDWTAMCGFLSANPIKHGSAEKALPKEVYDKLFETTRGEKLELELMNTKFLK